MKFLQSLSMTVRYLFVYVSIISHIIKEEIYYKSRIFSIKKICHKNVYTSLLSVLNLMDQWL